MKYLSKFIAYIAVLMLCLLAVVSGPANASAGDDPLGGYILQKPFSLTVDEYVYIAQHRKLRVVVDPRITLVDYYDAQQRSIGGVSGKVLEYIAKVSGLELEFIETRSVEESIRMINEGRADVMTGIYTDVKALEGKRTSIPYMKTPFLVLADRERLIKENKPTKKIAISQNFEYIIPMVQADNLRYELVIYPTSEQTLQAVVDGHADMAVEEMYFGRELVNYKFPGLVTVKVNDFELEAHFVFAQQVSPLIVDVFNKGIASINREDLQRYYITAAREAVKPERGLTPLGRAIAAFSILLFLILMYVIYLLNILKKQNRDISRSHDELSRSMSIYKELQNEKVAREVSNGMYDYVREIDVTNNELFDSSANPNITVADTDKYAKLPYDDFLSAVSNKYIDKEYKEIYLQNMSRQSLFDKFAAGIKNYEFEVGTATGDKSHRWYRANVCLYYSNLKEALIAMVFYKNIDTEKEHELSLLEKAQRDSLTGFYNKMITQQLIDGILSDPAFAEQKHAFLMFDIDNFKAVNDKLGHAVGDVIISELANNVTKILRGTDIIGRIGGDEFVVFMRNVPSEKIVTQKAEEIGRIFERSSRGGEKSHIHVTVSMGICMVPRDGHSFKELYLKADSALLTVKKEGKNTYRYFCSECMQAIEKTTNQEMQISSVGKNFADNIVEYVTEILYTAKDMDIVINSILEILGKHFDVSRAYIFEVLPENISLCNTFEWCDDDIQPCKEQMQQLDSTVSRDFLECFDAEGMFYLPHIEDYNGNLKELLVSQNVKVMFWVLMKEGDEIRGFLGFDECVNDHRLPSEVNRNTIKILVRVISFYLFNQRNKALLK